MNSDNRSYHLPPVVHCHKGVNAGYKLHVNVDIFFKFVKINSM